MNSQSSMSTMVSFLNLRLHIVPDSSAINHLTPGSNNLITKTAYTGGEQIHVGDRSGLDIQNIGCSSFHSTFNSIVLSLKQLLHVLSITKNLFSVSKFGADNKVSLNSSPILAMFDIRSLVKF